jgi:hypothetical protein
VNNNPKVRLDMPLGRTLGFSADPPPASPGRSDPSVGIKVSIVNPAGADPAAAAEFRKARAHDLYLPGNANTTATPDSAANQPDGVISLNTANTNLSPADKVDPNKYSLFAVVAHEIDEVLGTGSALDGAKNGDPAPTGPVTAEDLFRYKPSGARSFTTALKTSGRFPVFIQAYFSLDGTHDLARFNQQEGGDFADWYSPGGQTPQVQDAFGTPGATPLPAVELRVLDAVGYNRVPAQVYVDYSYSGSPNLGTFTKPYRTLATARDSVLQNGVIYLKGPAATAEVLSISKAVTLRAIGGAVTTGQ